MKKTGKVLAARLPPLGSLDQSSASHDRTSAHIADALHVSKSISGS